MESRVTQQRIARKMAFSIAGICLFLMLMGGCLHFYLDFRQERARVARILENAHESMSQLLEESLWITNDDLLATAMQGLLNFPYIEEVILRKQDGEVFRTGKEVASKPYVHEHEIVKVYRGREVHLGHVIVTADMSPFLQQLLERGVVQFATQAGLILLLAMASMWLFQHQVGRHLKTMTDYSKTLTPKTLTKPLVLARSKKEQRHPDELDFLVGTFNAMRENLHASLESLQESEALYRFVFESMAQGAFIQRADGVLTEANSALLGIFGLTLEQFQSKTSLDPDWNVIREDGSVFPGDQHPSMVALQTGKPVRNVVAGVYNPRQKKYIWLSINAIPQFKKNAIRPFQVFVTLHDITELKSIEKRLRQTQKLEALGTLAGGVAHDFNNLLYPIVGMAEMLMEDLPAESQGHDYAVEIFNAAWRGSELVRQILSFSRRSENETVPINLPQVLREALKLARSTIPSQIEMVTDILVEDCMVLAEPSQVHQIVMNLITNAYHAMESTGGTITVGLHKTAVPLTSSRDVLHAEQQYVLLSVADTGCGIEPAVIDRIFEPYFTTKEQGKGSGLGLAMVYGIVREFKGDVKVVSKVGEGTTVEVYLPLLMDKRGGESVDSLIVIESGTERILVVDDEAVIVKLEQQMLERLGYRVIATTVSEEALQLFKDNPDSFDVVLTDMAMPGMTGDQLAREILRIRPSISVIVCTGFSEQFSNGEFEQIGIKGILKKPVVKSELARMMRKVLDA